MLIAPLECGRRFQALGLELRTYAETVVERWRSCVFVDQVGSRRLSHRLTRNFLSALFHEVLAFVPCVVSRATFCLSMLPLNLQLPREHVAPVHRPRFRTRHFAERLGLIPVSATFFLAEKGRWAWPDDDDERISTSASVSLSNS